MMMEPDERQLAAWRALLSAHSLVIQAIERDLATAGLVPLTWYDVLVALWEAPDHRLRLHELAHAVLLSRSGLTRLVDRLEAAGLLRREPCADDRRGAYAVLTTEGRAAQLRAWPVYAHGIAAYFAQHLSSAETTVLATALTRVGAAPADAGYR
ncbi:MAG: MarR family transcriptional regulator [Chloroflexota bacterium]|nr:MarR family transcriptional regulator [Chloroflexota bacterium]